MTKEWYKQNGYRLSVNIDQAIIDRAERDVLEGYVLPILPTADPDGDDVVAHALADLAYLLIMQRNLFVTNAGTKEKLGANSTSAQSWSPLEEQASTAGLAIKRLKAKTGAVADAKIVDVCKLFFTTNFIHS